MPDPLGVTAARLRTLVPGFPDTYAVETTVPDEPGWWRLDAVPIAQWCADAMVRGNPRRLSSVAAMSVGGAVTHAVLARVTAALAIDGCAWDIAADALAVHRAAAGHIDRVALRHPVAWVAADDGGADDGGADDGSAGDPRGARRFPDEAALLDAVVAAAVATLAPLLREVRAATRFGLVPLWNAAADTVRLTTDQVSRYAGRQDTTGAAALAGALVDALIAHGAPIRSRGVEQPLPGRSDRMPVRASCCLAFRMDLPVARRSDALCTSCPLLPAPERARRYVAFVDGISGPDRRFGAKGGQM
jgi:AcrR family transcriptional regulator